MSAACPRPERLSAFHLGKLPLLELEALAEHLEGCERCATHIDGLSEKVDRLLSELRLVPQAVPLDDAESRRAIALVEKIGAGATSHGGVTLSEVHLQAGESRPLAPLGQYELLEKLGEGGMGAVYKARHRIMNQTVAIKVIHGPLVSNAEAVQRFHREIQSLAQLNHPHIVRALYADQAGDTHFLVMEYVEGTNLSQLVKEHGPVPVALACRVIQQAAAALQHAHENGLVHRDIKPANVLLQLPDCKLHLVQGPCPICSPQAAVAKLTDFGLALLRAEAPLGELTAAGQIMGTPDYMAPEQWEDSHQVDIRSDLYSLGCTLYHLLAGQPPFSGPEFNTLQKKIRGHTQLPPPPLQRFRPDAPPGLVVVVERMLAKDPARRYAAPAEVLAALAPFAANGKGQGQPETVSFAPGGRPAATPSRIARGFRFALSLGRLRIRVAVALSLLVLATLTWLAFRPDDRGALPDDHMVAQLDAESARQEAERERELALVKQRASYVRPSKDVAVHQQPPVALQGEPKQMSMSAAQDKALFTAFHVRHYRGSPPELLGEVGLASLSARFDDDVRLHVQFARPANCYLIAFNADGKEQLCLPREPTAAPQPLLESHYPESETRYFPLNDGVGVQAFVLAASGSKLPPYQEWRARAGNIPWQRVEGDGAWEYDGRRFFSLPRTRGAPREAGAPVPAKPVQDLAHFFKEQKQFDVVRMLVFPVRAK